jgi:hypothetical protein
MGFQFPNAPAVNDTFAAPGGPVYTWDGIAWKAISQGVPVTVFVSDSAPTSPAPGNLWWDSDSGVMSIWYQDADSAQWVQVSGNVAQNAPLDGGEYVLCNGVWRLKEQSFDLTGLLTKDIVVPSWGPSKARLTTYSFAASDGSQTLRFSVDGTTFPSTSGDYFVGGFYQTSNTSAVTGIANVAVTGIQMEGSHGHASIPTSHEITVELTRNSNAQAFGYRVLGGAGASAAAVWQVIYYVGYAFPASFPGSGPIKALRWIGNQAPPYGRMTVEWMA